MDNDSGKPQIAIGRVPCRPEVNVRSVEEDISRVDWPVFRQRTTRHLVPPSYISVRPIPCESAVDAVCARSSVQSKVKGQGHELTWAATVGWLSVYGVLGSEYWVVVAKCDGRCLAMTDRCAVARRRFSGWLRGWRDCTRPTDPCRSSGPAAPATHAAEHAPSPINTDTTASSQRHSATLRVSRSRVHKKITLENTWNRWMTSNVAPGRQKWHYSI